jgi:hypothetical protein
LPPCLIWIDGGLVTIVLSVSRRQLLVIDGVKLLRADIATCLCVLGQVADDLVSRLRFCWIL